MSLSRHRKEVDDDVREDGDSDNILQESGRAELAEGVAESKAPLLPSDEEVKKQASAKQEVCRWRRPSSSVSKLAQQASPQAGATHLMFCFVGLQASYLT